MSVIWHKVWSDLWNNKIRTVLAVLSITAGVFAVGVTFGMADQMLAGMDAAHQATSPSHIQMFLTQGISRNTAIRLKRVEGVEDVELGNFNTVRYKINPEDEWDSGWLVMRDNFEEQKYDTLQLKEGEWPEGKHLGIERLSSQYFKVGLGDKVIFDVDGKEEWLSFTGKVRHPFVPPPDFGGPAVFFTDAEGLERFGVSSGEFGQLLIRVTPYSDDYARQVASDLKDRLFKEGVGVAITNYQDPEKHWGRPIMEGINLVLQLMAVVSLGASVVLILNTLGALITQQTDQIGIIKAIGGTTGTIIKVYLTGVLVYGSLALFISLPLGAFLAFGLSQRFLNLFNIDYDAFQVSNQALILQAIAAIAVPLLAALGPVLNGARITVREAIASYGLGGNFGSSGFDRAVERVAQRLLSAPYAIAVGNMFRRKGRLILTQLVLIVAGTMFLAVMSLSSSITFTMDNDFGRRHYDSVIFFDGNERIDRAAALAQSSAGVERAEVWYTHSASILKEGQRTREAGFGVEMVGIPAGSDMFRPLIVGGRWLQAGDDRAIVINIDTAEDNEIGLGQTITLDLGELGSSDWQVVGFYSNPFGGGIGTMDSIYANQEAVFAATKKHNRGGQVYVRTRAHSAEYVEAVTTQLKDLYNARNFDTDFSQTLHEVREAAESQFGIAISMLLALAVIIAAVGGIGLMGSLSISVVERTREIGVMRAIGARTPTMMSMFVLEGVLQGVLSWLIVVPISFVLGKPMADGLGQAMFSTNLDYLYNGQAVLSWLVIILIISVLASVLPARNATRISVRESLAYA
ncbi:MAG: ABC transporter permease, partial [Anaerolineae bacterium]